MNIFQGLRNRTKELALEKPKGDTLNFSRLCAIGTTYLDTHTFYSDAVIDLYDLWFQGGAVNVVQVKFWLEYGAEGGQGIPIPLIKSKGIQDYFTGDDQQIKQAIYYRVPKNAILKVSLDNSNGIAAHQVNLTFGVRYFEEMRNVKW